MGGEKTRLAMPNGSLVINVAFRYLLRIVKPFILAEEYDGLGAEPFNSHIDLANDVEE